MININDKLGAPLTGNVQISLTEDEKKFFSEDNNFIEYFIEIGIKPEIFANETIPPHSKLYEINLKLKPEVISKFPFFDKKSMAIDSTLIDYVFPNNYRAINSPVKPEPEFYSLMLDNQFYSSVYSYKYIACLVIYEDFNLYKQVYDSCYNNKDKTNKAQESFSDIYVPKCLCLASVHPFISKFELILKELYNLSKTPKSHFLDLIIEKLICGTPKIPRGLKKICLKINNNVIDLTETKMNELPKVYINLKELFSIFTIDKIIDIFKMMLFEIKMIFFGNKKKEVTNIIMCFLLLLKPFTYQYRILSILPKKNYDFLEEEHPCIFGVSETYYESFFKDNNINIGDKPVLIVDIDQANYFISYNEGFLSSKDYPSIPRHLKEKLDKRTQEYKKNKKIEETNEGYQEIFFRFMINLLKDYPKYLKKNFNISKNKIDELFDKQGFINAQSSGEKEFYEYIISSQMFFNFVFKRMMPMDLNDKIEALFFEEKLNVKHAQKKIIRGNKILGQNILLPFKGYEYEEPTIIIDLTETDELDVNTINYFNSNKKIREISLLKGYTITQKKSSNELYFDYILFPILSSDKLFKYNCRNYNVPINLNQMVTKINEDLIHNCFIKFDDGKKNKSGESINDVYISYIIIFSLTLWYTDKEEREFRFNNMIQILNRIDKHDMEVTELLFNTLIDLGEEQLADALYARYNQLHVNVTWTIFSLMSKILHRKQNSYAGSIKDNKSNRSNRSSITSANLISTNSGPIKKNFRTRSIKLPDKDENILGEDILFDTVGTCLDCKSKINLGKICNDLLTQELDRSNRFMCKKCHNSSLQQLNINIGTELYNKMITKNSSSFKLGIVLYNPSTLKKKLIYISNLYKNTQFDVEQFRNNYPEEFWNAVWYFQLKGIDISFMLPYIKQTTVQIINNKNIINNYISIVTQDKSTISHDIINNEYRNLNNKIQKVRNMINVYNNDTLYIQHVYKFSIINIIGMIMYKTPDEYNGNIFYNEKILLVTDSKKKNIIAEVNEIKEKPKKNIMHSNNRVVSEEIKDIKEMKTSDSSNLMISGEIKEKPKRNIMDLNSMNISDFDITSKASSAFQIDNNEEYNSLMDGTIALDKENYSFYKKKTEKQNKLQFSVDEMFENIKEDDISYDLFRNYREEDDNNNDDY